MIIDLNLYCFKRHLNKILLKIYSQKTHKIQNYHGECSNNCVNCLIEYAKTCHTEKRMSIMNL